MKIKALPAVFLILGLCIGLFAGVNYLKLFKKDKPVTLTHVKGYKFISPLLDYEIPQELQSREILLLKNKMQKIIDNAIKENKVIFISAYFRDMLNGPWIGINEKENYAPASLLKVPLMIAYLKYAETKPEILNYKIMYVKDSSVPEVIQNIEPDFELKSGEYYTVENLIYRMIVYSDNASKDALFAHIDKKFLDKVYADMGIIVSGIRNADDFITAKDYAAFFRILFNASYLNRDMSEKALEILSKTTFSIGIVAGVPSGVTVSHKFGERGNLVNQTIQLHDCGIVYHKDRPYLLCVMTYGRDFKQSMEIIKDISLTIYENVDNYYKNN